MGDLTLNISRHEIECSCGCGSDWIDWEVIEIVQDACDHFAYVLGLDKVRCTIKSANRCKAWNKVPVSRGGPGSNDNSQHVKAKAIDFTIDGVIPADLYAYLDNKYRHQYGIGLYRWGVHVDSRPEVARWQG